MQLMTIDPPSILKALGILIATAVTSLSPAQAASPGSDATFWYTQPATDWEQQALPLGNGRLGGMVFGGVSEERIQFNVDSLWTGDQNPGGVYETDGMGAYQNFGNLYIAFDGHAEVEHYQRALDIENAVASVRYMKGGVTFQRQILASHPDEVIAVHLSADRAGQLSGRIRLEGAHEEKTTAKPGRLTIAGKLINGLEHQAQLAAIHQGGSVRIEGDQLVFTDCDELTLYLAAETNYVMDYGQKFMGESPDARVTAQVDSASAKSFAAVREASTRAHRELFDRVQIDLGQTDAAQLQMPTDQRLAAVRAGKADPDLTELLYQYGRYLLIGSSRPGTMPANLQGIWNESNTPPWRSDFHSNINLQMAYWPAETANLAECHTPLFDLLMASREPFREATRAEFGDDLRGFTIRTSHNPFGGMGWKWNIPASAWYARHFWEHYEFGGDKEYLKNVGYPYLLEVSQYWEDHLKELPDGRLVIPDGWSPEHGPREDGVSHDQQLVWDLFSNTIKAAEALGVDPDYRATLTDLRDRLLAPQIGQWGQIQEWMDDKDDPKDRHRHLSHLYAVYPAYQISRVKTPALAEAARVSLNARGDGTTGWSKAWKIALWGRLGDGARAHKIAHEMMGANFFNNGFDAIYSRGEKRGMKTYQIDGNLGFTAGICELLLQSHADEIQLLPALPQAWSTGSVSGLRARGGFEVDMEWDSGELVTARIRSKSGGDCVVRYGDATVNLSLAAGDAIELDGQLVDVEVALDARMAWWEEARFALFIHWGAYSVLGGEYKDENLAGKYAEQIQRIAKISGEDYLKDAASQFRPEKFDAEAWVKLAKDAGMKYIVITAKHHDGYTIYHSKHSEFDIEDAAGFERDPLKELSDACRKHGLKFGVYYSQSQDWHDVFDPSGDWLAPGNPAMNRGSTWSDPAKVENAAANRKMFEKYIKEKGVPQIVELIEDYGVDMIWYDTPGAYIREYARPFFDAARQANPDIIINARIGFGLGDYGGSSDSPAIFPDRAERYWEAIQSTLHSWGYNKFDEGSRRPTAYLLRMLATVVSKGGNMMINVGPKGDGTLVENDTKSLKEIASWSQHQIESIHGAGKSPLPAQNWGVVTRKENDLYLHVFDWPSDGKLRVGGLHTPVKSATLLIGKECLNTRFAAEGILEIDLSAEPSHPVNSVIRLHCQSAPEVDQYRLIEPTCMNRLHTADTSYYEGGVKSPLGMAVRAFVRNFNKPESAVTWKVRIAERGTYQLQVLYDLPHGTPPGDAYEISIGGQKLVSVVDGKSDGDLALITAEQDFMHMKESQKVSIDAMGQSSKGKTGPTQGMVIDQVGCLTLGPGVYDLTIKAAGEVRGNPQSKDLFNPRALFLEPVEVSQSGMTIHASNPELEKRMAWWEEARFALFIHWGAYSVLGGEYKGKTLEGSYAEQIQRVASIPHADYLKDAVEKFQPQGFDAEEWVKMAKAAGMKYVVITAKHHDGFAIYHSKHSEFDIGDASGFKRDPLMELADACRLHGLKLGVYYSQSQDWHEVFDPSGKWDAPDNFAVNPSTLLGDPAKAELEATYREMFETYMETKAIPQVVELIEDYGVDMIWFDTPEVCPPEYAQVFLDAVRETNADVVVNDRVGEGLGDYVGGPDSAVVFSYTERRYWEAIQSTLHSWGYNKFDEGSRRPTDYLLRMLATVVSKGGNLMINVGPRADGSWVENDIITFKEIAAWSDDYIQSISGADRSPLPTQNWGVVSGKGDELFLHVFDWPENGKLRVGGLLTEVTSASLMANDRILKIRNVEQGVLEIDVPSEPSHSVNSVIRLTCNSAPKGDDYRLLDPNSRNRFHVTDTPFITGEGIQHPIGVGHRAFLENWVDPEAQVVWKIRVAEKGTYNVQFLYDLPRGQQAGNDYQIQIEDETFVAEVKKGGTGDQQLIKDEIALMRMSWPRLMTVDDLGSVTLVPGVYDITLRSVGDIKSGNKSDELFSPRSLVLQPL